MSLDISKLQSVRTCGRKTTARCPACAEVGHDQTQDHLFIQHDGRFGCVVYPGDSPDAMEHRKRIFALCGNREIKPLVVRPSDLGRLGRGDQSHSADAPLKSGVLGRLGRLFQTHLATEVSRGGNEARITHELNDFDQRVLGVPNDSSTPPDRSLTENERALLIRWCGTDNTPPIILEARGLFNATIVGIDPADEKLHVGSDWVQMSLLDAVAGN